VRQKGFAPLIIILVIAILGVIGYLGYKNIKSKSVIGITSPAPTALMKSVFSPTPVPLPTDSFYNQANINYKGKKYEGIKPGDVLDDLIVKNVDSRYADRQLYAKISFTEDIKIGFKGEITLSGTLDIHDDKEIAPLTDQVCFMVDNNQYYLVPRLEGCEGGSWFCFYNTETARNLFSSTKNGSAASITIDDYTIYNRPSEVYDQATLVSIIKKK
jgi:hypothetical protein